MKEPAIRSASSEELQQILKWISYRLRALEQIAAHLEEMRELAEKAADPRSTRSERSELNHKVQRLQQKVNELNLMTTMSYNEMCMN